MTIHDDMREVERLREDARKVVAAWRNRFISERTMHYRVTHDENYEMARAIAESDANDFECGLEKQGIAIDAARAAHED